MPTSPVELEQGATLNAHMMFIEAQADGEGLRTAVECALFAYVYSTTNSIDDGEYISYPSANELRTAVGEFRAKGSR